MRRPRPAALALLLLAAALPVRAQRATGGELEIALGGDVIFDAPILYAIDRFYADRTEPALEELFSDLTPALTRADLAIVNLECPIAERTFVRSADHDAPTFAAPPAFAAALARAGVDAVVVANNHAYDQGVAGLASTLAETRRAGLVPIGSGADAREAARAIVIERAGRRIAVAAFSEGSNRRVRDEDADTPRIAIASEERIAASVRDARARADLVIASLHWTGELDHDRPTRAMARLARAAADAGADLIYAHGTHVPGPRGSIVAADGRAVPVLWSLGNLVAVMEEDDDRVHEAAPSVRDALLARVHARDDGGRLVITGIEAEPYWIATPERAWSAGSATAMVRPLSVRGELARIAAASCGARCARYERSYRAREEMIARLMGGGTGSRTGSGSGTESETGTGTGSEAGQRVSGGAAGGGAVTVPVPLRVPASARTRSRPPTPTPTRPRTPTPFLSSAPSKASSGAASRSASRSPPAPRSSPRSTAPSSTTWWRCCAPITRSTSRSPRASPGASRAGSRPLGRIGRAGSLRSAGPRARASRSGPSSRAPTRGSRSACCAPGADHCTGTDALIGLSCPN